MSNFVLEGIVAGHAYFKFCHENSQESVVVPFEFKAAYYEEEIADSDYVIELNDINSGISEVEFSIPTYYYPKIDPGSILRMDFNVINNKIYYEAVHIFKEKDGELKRVLSYFE